MGFLSLCSNPRTGKRRPRRCPSASITRPPRVKQKLQLMNIINDCMRYASNREEFIALMESEGLQGTLGTSPRNITYTTPAAGSAVTACCSGTNI